MPQKKYDQYHSLNGIVSFRVKPIYHILGIYYFLEERPYLTVTKPSFLNRKNSFPKKLWTGMSIEFHSASLWLRVVLHAESG